MAVPGQRPVSPNMLKRAYSLLNIWLADTWALEVGAFLLCCAALAVIIVLLIVYEGKSQFSFAGVTMNAVIAVLAAIVRIGLLVPVSEGLAQWKWLWFANKSRRLGEFAAIDEASRGSKGSLLFLLQTRGMTLTSLGAVVVLLSVATEPFIQQVVSFQDTIQFADAANVNIPFAQKWAGGSEIGAPPNVGVSNPTGNFGTALADEYGSVSNIQLSIAAQSAVQFGLDSDKNAVIQNLAFACPSGNCTWPVFESLAICSKCNDVSDLVKSVRKTDFPMGWHFPNMSESYRRSSWPPQNLTSYYLPNGLSIDNRREDTYHSSPPVAMTALVDLRPSTSLSLSEMTTLLFSATFLRVSPQSYPKNGVWPSQNGDIQGTECGIYVCLKQYQSNVVDGQLEEESKELAATRDPNSFTPYFSVEYDSVRYLDGVTPDADALFSNVTYFTRTDLSIQLPSNLHSDNLEAPAVNISQAGIDGLSVFISALFNEGTFTNVTFDTGDNATDCSTDGKPNACGRPLNLTAMAVGGSSADASSSPSTFSPAVMDEIWNAKTLDQKFENLATSITNEFRRNAVGSPLLKGKAGTPRTVIRARWRWIALPAALVFLSFTFFILAVVESQRQAVPLWKASALAVLMHGLEAKVRDTMAHLEKPSEMEAHAEEVKIRLGRDTLDDALMLRTAVDHTISLPMTSSSADNLQQSLQRRGQYEQVRESEP